MNKFYMLTRGRTGSSAILDELGTSNVYAQQELFADFSTGIAKETLTNYSKYVPPLDIWKEIYLNKDNSKWSDTFAIQQKNMGVSEKMLYSIIGYLDKAAPYLLNNNRLIGRQIEKYLIGIYLDSIESQAYENKKGALIFKILSHNFTARKSLLDVLRNREYRALLLIRKNVVRQVLSGLIAESRSIAEGRNLYNKRSHVGEHSACIIDLDKFERCVAGEITSVEGDRSLLKKNGIKYLEISYEDFCEDREKFYSEIFSFMGINYELPQLTDFSIMVPDIRKAVANFEELEARVANMGMKGSL